MIDVYQAMDMFDMSDGFPSLLESFSRIKCPTLVWSYITTLFCIVIPFTGLRSKIRHSVSYYTAARNSACPGAVR